MSPVLTEAEINAELWRQGGIKFGRFTNTRYHLLYPDAEMCPLRIEMRSKPRGPLDPDFIFEIGRFIASSLWEREVRASFQAICGVPNAGDLLVDGFLDVWPEELYRVQMLKEGEGLDRTFVHKPQLYPDGVNEIMIADDVVTSIITKMEVAAEIARATQGQRWVSAVAVGIDRSANACEQLLMRGITLFSPITTDSMVASLLSQGFIDTDQAEKFSEEMDIFNAGMRLRMSA